MRFEIQSILLRPRL